MLKDNLRNVSYVILFTPLILTLIGIVFIFSSGINPDGTNSDIYLKQLLWIAIGLALAFLIISIDYFRIVETSVIYYVAGIIMLVITLIFGKNIRGSTSWLGFGGLGIQPSEIMKICYILFFAKYLANAPVVEKKRQSFIYSLGILAAPLGLIMLQPDLGTAIVFLAIFVAMAYLGLADDTYIRYILLIAVSTAVIILGMAFYKYYLENGGVKVELIEVLLNYNTLLFISIAMFLYSAAALIIDFFNPVPIIQKLLPITLIVGVSFFVSSLAFRVLKPYQWKRLLVTISPEFDKAGSGYNIIQSKIAIGSGGFFGKGLFRGTQNKLGFLPEKNTDFIFSIISEETGFFGASIVIGLFMLYLFYIFRTIQTAKDKEGMLVSTGLFAMFGIHFLINVGMTLGVTPATGLPLPFISYGGSSYLAFIIGSALLANIYVRRFVH